jgi:hypothetical protein
MQRNARDKFPKGEWFFSQAGDECIKWKWKKYLNITSFPKQPSIKLLIINNYNS